MFSALFAIRAHLFMRPIPGAGLRARVFGTIMRLLTEYHMKHFLTLALVVTSLFAHSQKKDHPDGEIKGTVTDQNGSPVSAATVYAVPQDVTFDSITPRSIETDRNGGFDFRRGFQFGSYKLYSRKDADTYPD